MFALIFAPNLASAANSITTQQARTEYMRACLSSKHTKDLCLCSFDKVLQSISVDDLLVLNRSLVNKIPGNEKHLVVLEKSLDRCEKEIDKGVYSPANTASSGNAPSLPSLPTPSSADAPQLPTPPSFADLDNSALPAPPTMPSNIPEPPSLQKTSPAFDKDKGANTESYFSDTSIDANEDPDKVAGKSAPSETQQEIDIPSLRESYNGQHDAAFFEAAARGDVRGLTAIDQYLRSVDLLDKQGNTPLLVAVDHSQLPAVKFLLEHKANANVKNKAGQTPLHIAVFKRRPDIVRLLLSHKANINAAYGTGFTPLILAIMNRDEMMINNLLISGANIKLGLKDGNLPIHVAASSDNGRIIQILKNYGADLNAENALGYTPLMVAASENRVTAASALLALGADFTRTDIYGRNAAQIAYALGHQQIVNLVLTMQEKRSGY